MPPRAAASGSQTVTSTPGILAVNPAQLQPQPTKTTPRLKIIVRRLPPLLTRAEFEEAMGADWKLGPGKVDWLEYAQGKLRSPGKHPEQSRAYVHFTKEAHIWDFEASFLAATFHDAKGSWRHAELRNLPPTVEFAPCQRVPSGKTRADNRQGLIDQDPEYMAFLEGETQVAPRAQALDAMPRDRTKEIVKSTPLIEALREKKAAKAKSSGSKAAKGTKDEASSSTKAKGAVNKPRKQAQLGAKVTPKTDAKNKEATRAASKADKPATSGAVKTNPEKKRERQPVSIKDRLQRDLGLTPSPRRGGEKVVATEKSKAQAQTSVTPPGNSALANRNPKLDVRSVVPTTSKTVPAATLTADASPSVAATSPQSQQQNKTSQTNGVKARPQQTNARPTKISQAQANGATKAYIKHANASQGITDDLLSAALSNVGELLAVHIDKRKGTALAEFKTTDGLAAALAKRTVPVAGGAVEVLEFKDRSSPQAKPTAASPRPQSSRGRVRGRGGSTAAATAPTETSKPG